MRPPRAAPKGFIYGDGQHAVRNNKRRSLRAAVWRGSTEPWGGPAAHQSPPSIIVTACGDPHTVSTQSNALRRRHLAQCRSPTREDLALSASRRSGGPPALARERAQPQAGGAPHSVARVGAALAVVIRQRAPPLAGAVSAACCCVLVWRWRRSHPGASNYDHGDGT